MSLIPTKICYGSAERPAHLVNKDQFTKDSARDDGLAVYCKVCAADRQRAWKHQNPEKVKAAKQAYTKNKRHNDLN